MTFLKSSTKHYRIQINLVISFIILLGFLTVGFSTYAIYSKLIKEDIVNISKLTASNIYGEIGNELTKPIFVSLTMANDSFVKKWILDEQANPNTKEHRLELQQYLLGIKSKYLYDSVFLISDPSKIYYHYEGINKIISPTDSHDVWYYNFVNSQMIYDLDVDTDQANQNRLSVFINCRIVDEDKSLLGVTGVGLEIQHVQELLSGFENNYKLEAILFSRDGSIQIDSAGSHMGAGNLFTDPILQNKQEAILANRTGYEIIEFKDQPYDGYYITKYIEDLDWYLLVKKDTSDLAATLNAQIYRFTFIYIFVTAFVLLFANRIITKHRLEMLSLTKTDTPTGLMNRRGFNEKIQDFVTHKKTAEATHIFIFDIDNFKHVNDRYGHIVGDNVLNMVGQLASSFVGTQGNISRWGGDEFAGSLNGTSEELIPKLDSFLNQIRNHPELSSYGITISLGITKIHMVDSAESVVHRADQALYKAKDLGKNCYYVMEIQQK